MYRFLAGVVLILLLAVPRVEAQEGLGSPIFKHEATKEVLISKVKRGCPSDLFNVTCAEFLGTLQAADAEGAPKFTKDLALYLESLEEGLCGTEEARLATFYAFPRRIMFNEVRRFGPTEMCLKRGGKNILSLKCGNANVTDLKVALSAPAPVKDTAESLRTIPPTMPALIPTIASAPVDTMPKREVTTAAIPMVVKKSHKTRNIVVGAVVAAGIACAILCRADVEQTVNVNGQPQNPGGDKGGAPVNPLNNRSLMTAGAGIRIRF